MKSCELDMILLSFDVRYRLLVLNQIPQDADPSDPLAYASWMNLEPQLLRKRVDFHQNKQRQTIFKVNL